MKIDNRTHFQTSDLRHLLQRVAEIEFDPDVRKRLRVEIRYGRRLQNGACSGRARLGSPWTRVRVPSTGVDPVDFAMVAAHEMAHVRGLRHRDMNTSRYDRTQNWREVYAWAADYPIGVKEKKPRPGADQKLTVRLAHARKMLGRHTHGLKLETTLVKRWKARVKYYEKKIAAFTPQNKAAEIDRVTQAIEERQDRPEPSTAIPGSSCADVVPSAQEVRPAADRVSRR